MMEEAPADAVKRVQRIVMDSPFTKPALRRLTWSFYRGAIPDYLEDTYAREGALVRFTMWALHAARTEGGRTVAQRAIAADRKLGTAERELLSAAARLRYGLYEVQAIENQAILVLIDKATGERFRVHDVSCASQVDPGHVLLGAIQWPDREPAFLGPGMLSYDSFDIDVPVTEELPDWPLLIEQAVFGANLDWIEELDISDLRSAYEEFRADVKLSGLRLPGISSLRQQVMAADSPTDVLSPLLMLDWWSEYEVNVLLAFIQAIWNSAPRPERGGFTPRELAAAARPGPQETRLLELLTREISGVLEQVETLGDDVEAIRRRIDQATHEWLHTPRADLRGETPMQVIARERRTQRGL